MDNLTIKHSLFLLFAKGPVIIIPNFQTKRQGYRIFAYNIIEAYRKTDCRPLLLRVFYKHRVLQVSRHS